MNKTTIILADDHVLVRAGIKSLLEQMQGIEVVGEAGDGREAFKLIKQLRPDIVLMDVAMSHMNGIEATERIKRAYDDVKVVILSMHSNEEYVLQALRAGASGYLLKDAATLELELAVRSVFRNETYLSPGVSKHVIESYRKRIGASSRSVEQLTPRQRENIAHAVTCPRPRFPPCAGDICERCAGDNLFQHRPLVFSECGRCQDFRRNSGRGMSPSPVWLSYDGNLVVGEPDTVANACPLYPP